MTEDKKNNIRVRFAPSPTGYIHIGNVRTALFNWLFARKNKGVFVLRIEDTDAVRSRDEYVDAIVEGLSRFGLEWDEGPDMGGSLGPYKQSQRTAIYEKHLKSLQERDLVYECFCQPDELEEMKKRKLEKGEQPIYSGKCSDLSEKEKRALRGEGKQPAIRFRVKQEEIVVKDLIRGDVTFNTSTIGDFIIFKSDGLPSFHFAVAADDGEMKISHVIRGEDHLTNTPKHIMILNALGFVPPLYAHLPMIVGDDHQPLSKRHGHVSIKEYLEEGYLPASLMNYLALLGWSSGDDQEIFTPAELIKKFDLLNVNKSSAVFDTKKLNWMGMQHMKNIPDTKLAQLVIPYLKSEEIMDCKKHVTEEKFDHLKKVVNVLRPYLSKLKDILKYADIFLCNDVKYSDEVTDLLKKDESQKIMKSILKYLPVDGVNKDSFNTVLSKVKEETGVKGKSLFLPIRAAVTGRLKGPELVDVFPLLSFGTLKERFEKALKI